MTTSTKAWLLGLIAAIVTPVAIYWLTPPRTPPADDKPATNSATVTPPATPPAGPATPAEPVTYAWDGRVIDQTKGQLLQGVDVSLTITGGATISNDTDSEGRFIFVVSRSTGLVTATLKAAAAGYKEFTRNMATNASGELDHLEEIQLAPLPPSAPVNPALKRPLLMSQALATRYKPKSIDQASTVRIPAGALAPR